MWGCLADEHISGVLVNVLRQRGVDAVTVHELGLAGEDDAAVAQVALAQSRIILTRDADFLRLSAEANQQGQAYAPVAYWKQGVRRSVPHLVSRIVGLSNQADYAAICSLVFFL